MCVDSQSVPDGLTHVVSSERLKLKWLQEPVHLPPSTKSSFSVTIVGDVGMVLCEAHAYVIMLLYDTVRLFPD